LYDGWRWREKRQMQHMAQMASWLTMPHVKKPIDPHEFLGEKREDKKKTPEENKKMVDDLIKQLGEG
jgi:hypothetical protein